MTNRGNSRLSGETRLLVCDCEGTMKIDAAALAGSLALGGETPLHNQLCRRQISRYEEALQDEAPLLVACTQEAPLFREIGEENGRSDVTFVNIRERAGWCENKAAALPKMAALIADAGYQAQPTGAMTITSQGQCLVYGAGQQALDVAEQLSGRLSVTVVLTEAGEAIPPTTVSVPLHIGRIRQASGSLGAFALSLDGFAPVIPSSKTTLEFEPPRDGFSTSCDLILDLSDGPALFADGQARDGYIKVDRNHPAAVAKAMFDISDFVGDFEKPLYVNYDGDICAHGRSAKVGCRNCLDNCPTGAITPNGDIVEIDPALCGGCGNCSAVCPTGAVSYAYPERQDTIRRIQLLADTYRSAGGSAPTLVLHEDQHGSALIAMMARYGRGLPVNAIPLALYSVFQIGHEVLATALAAGFHSITVIAPPDKTHDLPALESQVGLVNHIMEQMGFGDDRVSIVLEHDPDAVEAQLLNAPAKTSIVAKTFAPVGGKREVARLALAALNGAAAEPHEIIPLPAGAPYGRLDIDTENCTVCLACVGACPAGALSDDEERPRLSFNEAACVQCGLCVATCPERVIKLEPRYNFSSAAQAPLTVKEEEPFACISCGKPFGTKSSIERIVKTLQGKHSMFQNAAQVDIIKMCDDCRVIAISDSGGDPMALGERPKVRTTDDYLIDDAAAKDEGPKRGGG